MMNYRMTAYILGSISVIMAILMTVPFIMTFGFREDYSSTTFAFGLTIAILLAVGIPCIVKRPQNTHITSSCGFVTVALAWIMMSIVGAIPLCVSGVIPNFIDCIFEMVSGFTTTGATIMTNIEGAPNSILFWRSMTHWIGGMGILVFVVALLPKSNPAVVHLMKAEVPGPEFGKLVSKLRFTARILYCIYLALTILEVVLLVASPKMTLFDAVVHSMSTAGTGGFSNKNLSVGFFDDVYIDVVITVFMMLFATNFNIFYFILIGHVSTAFRNEELRTLFIIYALATLGITISLTVNNIYESFWTSLRYAAFQTASMMSTTGFVTADFNTWPTLTHILLLAVMFVGGSAGSTAGGLKVSRIVIGAKSSFISMKKSYSPRGVFTAKLDGRPISDDLRLSVANYFVAYFFITVISLILISLAEPTVPAALQEADSGWFVENFSAVATCINNVGPGLGSYGPMHNFAHMAQFSKIVLCFDMLIGRLEIVPMLLLFYPKAWTPAK